MRAFVLSCKLLAASLVGLCLAHPVTAGAIEDLRQALKAPVDNLAKREQDLRDRVAALSQVGEASQALLLQEWRDDEIDPQIAAVDGRVWRTLARRFEESLRDNLRAKDSARKISALTLVSETGVQACALGRRTDFLRDFASDLVNLAKSAEPGVAEAAARALGSIRPDPQLALPPLKQLLDAEDAGQRLAAAEGLLRLMSGASLLARKGQCTKTADSLRAEAGVIGSLVVPVAARGLADPQTDVRRACVETLREAAALANSLVFDPRRPDEPDDWQLYRREVESERGALSPVVFTLEVHGPVLGRLLGDPDGEVRQTARRTLEELALARQRLLARTDSIAPPLPRSDTQLTPRTASEPTTTRLLPGERARRERMPVEALVPGLSDRDVKTRLATIDVLEALGPAAAPAGQALVKALGDSNRFVRWAAARALGTIGAVVPETAVPALIKLLSDSDVDLRVAAATTLARYGQAARPALPALIGALGGDDATLRVAALNALASIGLEAQPALPAIRDALDDRDAQVRQSAARLLGKFGPSARDALDSLRMRLKDVNPEVRTAARDALMNIGR
jgi:HEAT repeat protein